MMLLISLATQKMYRSIYSFLKSIVLQNDLFSLRCLNEKLFLELMAEWHAVCNDSYLFLSAFQPRRLSNKASLIQEVLPCEEVPYTVVRCNSAL